MNDILTSILSALHSFLTFPNNFIKREKDFFERILGDPVKIEMVYKGNQRSKKLYLASFIQDQKRETRRNRKILATSQMDEMAPENVTTSGT